MQCYFRAKCPDCYLYSRDGAQFKIHKELFGQTKFLRKILSSTKGHCYGILEIICPCTKKELSYLVDFLYSGEIHCKNEKESLKIVENLEKMFGFDIVIRKQSEEHLKNPHSPVSDNENGTLPHINLKVSSENSNEGKNDNNESSETIDAAIEKERLTTKNILCIYNKKF